MTLALVPPDGAHRAHILRIAQQTGAEVLAPSEQDSAEVWLLDLTAPGGRAALEQLKTGHDTRPQAAVALVDSTDPGFIQSLLEAGVADLVAVERLELELPFRLSRALSREAQRREAQKREKDLSLLLNLTADYAGSLDVETLLHDVTRKLAEELDILRASLVVVDEQREAAYVIAASDDKSLKELRIELSRYPEIREVVRTGKPVLLEDAPSHPLLDGVKSQVAARGIHSIAALPLSVEGRVLGVLLLRGSHRRNSFSPREMDVLATVAHATAIALRNARLLEKERGRTELEKSARIAAEEKASRLQRYEAYFASISEGVAILDDQARVLTLNPAGAEILELTPAAARGKHINGLTAPTDEGVLLDMLWSTSRGEVRREIDVMGRTGKGRSVILSISAAPMHEGDATAIVSFRDVTRQRELADELRKTQEFQEKLIDSSVDAIIAADLKGKIILFNKGAEKICGYTSEEAVALMNVRQLYPPGIARELMMRLRSGDEGGKGRLNVTRQEILKKTGEKVPVNMTASILYEGDREVATVGIFTDLRERVQLERKLSDAEIRLEESERNAVIVALAGTAAHELNQPLTSVMGYAELLKRRLGETDFAFRPVDIIYREAERMAEIVRKIGKITRYETKTYIGQSKILDLDKSTAHED